MAAASCGSGNAEGAATFCLLGAAGAVADTACSGVGATLPKFFGITCFGMDPEKRGPDFEAMDVECRRSQIARRGSGNAVCQLLNVSRTVITDTLQG
jgi:hypothetical protein